MNRSIFPDSFLDWWFSPWEYAGADVHLPYADDGIGMRDGYRAWCDLARVPADFPSQFDVAWHVASARDTRVLRQGARLFAGLYAARAHQHDALCELSLADRKWCAGIASVQPLHGWPGLTAEGGMNIEERGLAELAVRIERGFPGVWARLRLLLPDGCARKVDTLLGEIADAKSDDDRSAARAQRCWQMCMARASGGAA